MFARADVVRLPLQNLSVDLVLGSPPYLEARDYGIGAKRKCREWVEWMLTVTDEAMRVSRGPVVWVASGGVRKFGYRPACEGLMWRWWERGGECHLHRPCYFHREGIPGSGGPDWFRADVEHVMCFKRPGRLPWSDNTAMGHAPKWAPGGAMSHRMSDGTRRNQWGGSEKGGGTRKVNGERLSGVRPSHVYFTRKERVANGEGRTTLPAGERRLDGEVQNYLPPVIANPGNLIHMNVGGGLMGSSMAHDNEAPFPEQLAEWFIRSCCPPGGLVLDPFSGSGTTVAVAQTFGRLGLGIDIRQSQCELGARRIKTVTPMLKGID